MATRSNPVCKDCRRDGVAKPRPATFPGPRCFAHHRLFKRLTARRRRERRVKTTYTLTPTQLRALEGMCLKNEKGEPMCMICTRYRARAVDHDHKCCKGKTSCGRCVRGLLCGNCNTMLGRQGDIAETFLRAAQYLAQPPATGLVVALPTDTVVHSALPSVD